MTTQFRNSSSATVFDIYLLQEQICENLSTRDIRCCCLVSRNFYQNFTPYLYRSININNTPTFDRFCQQESLDSLQRNRDHVIEVSSHFSQLWKIMLTYQCFNITTLKCPTLKRRSHYSERNMLYIQHVIALVQSCPNLQVLEAGNFSFDRTIIELFCKTIRDHDTLQELDTVSHKSSTSEVMMNLWNGKGSQHLKRYSFDQMV